MSVDLALLGAGCVVSAVLLCSGLAKLAVPGPAGRALAELMRVPRARAAVPVRTLAAGETAAAVALLLPGSRFWGALAVALLGVAFAVAGLVGIRRGADVPCGCLGGDHGRPLGARNVGAGLALTAAAVWVAASAGRASPGGPLPVVVTAGLTLAWCGCLHRALIRDLTRSWNAPTDASGVA